MKKYLFIGLAVLGMIFAVPASSVANNGKCQSGPAITPDLVITNIKIDTSDSKEVKVLYTVKNNGKVAAKPSKASVKLTSKKNKADTVAATNIVPTLDPGKSYTTEINYPIRSKGDFVINATADYNKRIIESNESNNTNTVGFSIGIKIGK